MRGVILLFCVFLALACAAVPARGVSRFEKTADNIAGDILKSPARGEAIAVVPFKSPDGTISRLGGLMAARLTARLVNSGKVAVVDRRYLARVLGELKLQLSGLTEQTNSAEMGKFTGAKFLLLGDIEPLGADSLAVNARLVETRTGRVAAVSRAELELDAGLRALYGSVSEADTAAETFYAASSSGQAAASAEKPLKVELLLSQDSFAAGQAARAVVSVNSEAAVYLYSVDAAGGALRLFPPPGASAVVEAARPLFFPGEAAEKEGTFLEAFLPPGKDSSSETLRVFAVASGAGVLLDGAASYAAITSRLAASGLPWAQDFRVFTIHK